MKLLFDENLPPKLPHLLAELFPDSIHARDCGLLGQTDDDVWEYASSHNLTIISKDSDFQQRSLLYGHPPKVVWLRFGNCTRQQLLQLITTRAQDIRELEADPFASILVLT